MRYYIFIGGKEFVIAKVEIILFCYISNDSEISLM